MLGLFDLPRDREGHAHRSDLTRASSRAALTGLFFEAPAERRISAARAYGAEDRQQVEHLGKKHCITICDPVKKYIVTV